MADARVLRSSPMYFRFVKKLISPGVASPSDAAPVIFSVGSPTSSPPDWLANSLRVKLIEKTVREEEFTSQIKCLGMDCQAVRLSGAPGGRALPNASSDLCSSQAGVFR